MYIVRTLYRTATVKAPTKVPRFSGHGKFLSRFPVPPPHSRLLTNKIYASRIIKILSRCARKIYWHILIRSCQDLIKVSPEIFIYQDLGKMSQVFQGLSRSCMTWQGVSSFVSLGFIL